ncbi:MAG: hypothetical protein M3R63_16325 [Actinomycetota bacterium]|nr:hypothetical protein [Actinomycetota bacterium]
MNISWALAEINKFLRQAELYKPHTPGVVDMTGQLANRGNTAEIVASAQIVEQITSTASFPTGAPRCQMTASSCNEISYFLETASKPLTRGDAD